ncbi:MAG: type II secretion system F family protein [Planctomycetota bacterium]
MGRMATYRYDAIDARGARSSGVLEAASEAAAASDLRARKLRPIRVRSAKDGLATGLTAFRRRGPRVGVRKLATTYTQLADLLRAGVPLLRALSLIGERKSDAALSAVFSDVAARVADGAELADAMAENTDQFARIHVAMVRAGEQAGDLEDVLQALGEMLEAQANLRAKVIGSLIYPGVLVTVGGGIIIAVFTVFVPMFRPLFARLGDSLPLPTKLVFALSDAVTVQGPATLVVLGLLAAAGVWAGRREDVRAEVSRIQTRAPLLGPLVRSLAAARFCRLLGSMLGSGVPLLGAMKIARDAADNRLLEEAVDGAMAAVAAGRSLADPLRESGLFEPDVVEMIAVGENANNLDHVLGSIAEAIERKIDRLLSVLLKLIEPAMLLLIAGGVVFVAVALLVPMMELSGSFDR